MQACGPGIVRIHANKKTSYGKSISNDFHDDVRNYVISGNRIYYDTRDGSLRHFSVKLNGKGLKKTNVIARTKYNASNKKGYKLIKKGMKVYLKTPKFKMYLGENNTVPLDAEY